MSALLVPRLMSFEILVSRIYGRLGARCFSGIYRMEETPLVEEKPTVSNYEEEAESDTMSFLDEINKLKGDNWKPKFFEERPTIREYTEVTSELFSTTSDTPLFAENIVESPSSTVVVLPKKDQNKYVMMYEDTSGLDELEEEDTMSLYEIPEQIEPQLANEDFWECKGLDSFEPTIKVQLSPQMQAEAARTKNYLFNTQERTRLERMDLYKRIMNNFTCLAPLYAQGAKKPDCWPMLGKPAKGPKEQPMLPPAVCAPEKSPGKKL